MASESPPTRDLKALFCEHFNCPPSKYEKRALRKCLYLHARIIAPLLRWFSPGCFERDLVLIDYFGKAKNWQEVTDKVAALRYQDLTKPRFARNTLRIRISGRKANKLAAKLLPNAKSAPSRMGK
jgi:hypothetical protein